MRARVGSAYQVHNKLVSLAVDPGVVDPCSTLSFVLPRWTFTPFFNHMNSSKEGDTLICQTTMRSDSIHF